MSSMVYIDEADTFLSYLPLHHIYELSCGFLCPMSRGCTVAFAEGLGQIGKNLKEVAPTVMLCVPSTLSVMNRRVWENIRVHGAEGRVRRMIDVANAIPNPKLRVAAKRQSLAAIHKSFGGKLRLLITGGAPADPEDLRGLRELGIPVLQGYGVTECAPIVALNRDTWYRDDAAGLPTPNTLLDIGDMQEDGVGEIRYRGDGVMLGYDGMPEETAAVIRDGWFYTGDLGYLDSDGFLHIIGRKRNVIRLADGRKVFPEELEQLLRRSPWVREVVVVSYPNGEGKDPSVVAVIAPDLAYCASACGESVAEAQLETALRRVVAEVNSGLPPHKRMTDFVIRREAFPVSATGKTRRAGVAEAAFGDYQRRRDTRK
jgi:long-chain acyl-CoA synthetase